MGLKADIDEVTANWSKSPWWLKTWLFLSGFLAISSIASLAESITKWKGFFKDAIQFYREWISTPLRELLEPLGIHLLPRTVDFEILYVLLAASLIRYFIVTDDPSDKWDRRLTVLLSIIFLATFLMMTYRANNAMVAPNWTTIIAIVSVNLVAPALLKMQKIWIYYLQIGAVFSIVALMAAINTGLSK